MLRKIFLLMLLIMTAGCAAVGVNSAKGEAPRITKEQLKEKLGAQDLVLLDVRSGRDWEAGDKKIAGAVREDPRDFEQWAAKYPKDKTLVLYCA